MKHQLRGIHSRLSILEAALYEFAHQGYGSVTIDFLCHTYNFSKGMIYHYFKGKDHLFLSCVEYIFSDLATTLEREVAVPGETAADTSLENMIEDYYRCRREYFETQQEKLILFQSVMLSPPPHLQQEVEKLRGPLKDLNRRLFSAAIDNSSLPCKINKELALRYLETVESVFWKMTVEFTGKDGIGDIETEKQHSQLLNMLLHGIF